jgi:hypothetical protein
VAVNRTSFAGALTAVGIGAVLAFAIQGSPRDLDLHAAGLIILLAGLADLAIRTFVANSPLLSTQAAAVAAVVEPLGAPVLDVFGNPIALASTPHLPNVPMMEPSALVQDGPMTLQEPLTAEYEPTEFMADPHITDVASRDRVMALARARDHAIYEHALAAASDGAVADPMYPVSASSGRRPRVRRRRTMP